MQHLFTVERGQKFCRRLAAELFSAVGIDMRHHEVDILLSQMIKGGTGRKNPVDKLMIPFNIGLLSSRQDEKRWMKSRKKWKEKYPRAMKRWYNNWDAVSPIFKFSKYVRMVIYTTNAIESLNSTYCRLNSQRSVFPSDTALLKALYLATFEATKK